MRERFDLLLSVEDADAWKPTASAYAYAAKACDVSPAEMLMVASHPWDVDGARRAGLQTAWVNRSGGPFPGTFQRRRRTPSRASMRCLDVAQPEGDVEHASSVISVGPLCPVQPSIIGG